MNLWAKLIRCRNFLFQNRHFRTINYLNYGTSLFDGELVRIEVLPNTLGIILLRKIIFMMDQKD
jgi:hypothetical protein